LPGRFLLPGPRLNADTIPILGGLNGDGTVDAKDHLLPLNNWHKRAQPATSEIEIIAIMFTHLESGARPWRLTRIPSGDFPDG